MNIAIVGQGAIGSVYTYYYRELSPVILVRHSRRDPKTIINEQGETSVLDFPIMDITKPYANNAKAFDGLIIAVKGYHLAQLIEQITPWLTTNTRLILVQNGMGGAQLLADAFPQNELYVGTTTDAAYAQSNSQFKITATGRLDIGILPRLSKASKSKTLVSPSAHDASAEQNWINTFISYHPNALYHCDMTQALYTKLAINVVINPLTAVMQLKNGRLRELPQKVEALKQEVFAVYKAIDIAHSSAALSLSIDIVIEATAENWSSMNQDIKHKRRTENDALLGYLLGAAKSKNIHTPVMSDLYQQIASIDGQLR